ncbi:hypothetical protein ACQ4PT_025239 [Festuca glaucescens]
MRERNRHCRSWTVHFGEVPEKTRDLKLIFGMMASTLEIILTFTADPILAIQCFTPEVPQFPDQAWPWWPWGGEKHGREEALKEEEGISHVELCNLHPRWTPASALKRHRFLTHAHRDHLTGITTASVAGAVYASRLTVIITPSGMVMFLFEGAFGNVLHTGDCHLTPECIQGLPLR